MEASLLAQMVKNLPAVWETWLRSLGQEDPLEKGMATRSSILAWKSPWTEEPGRLQSVYSSVLAWRIPGTGEPGGLPSRVAQSQTGLSKLTFTFHLHALEKEMATHSSVLAWRIPGMGEPGGLVGLWGRTCSNSCPSSQ